MAEFSPIGEKRGACLVSDTQSRQAVSVGHEGLCAVSVVLCAVRAAVRGIVGASEGCDAWRWQRRAVLRGRKTTDARG